MEKQQNKTTERVGFKKTVGIAGLVGLIGGLLFGVWDSVTVIFEHTPSPLALSEIFFLTIYAVAIYALIGCLGMAVIGVATSGVISSGEYSVRKPQLAGIFVGVFVLLAISALLARSIMRGNTIEILEYTVIGMLSGVGLAALSVYVLNMGIRKEKLIAVGISLLTWLLVFLYGGLWVNLSLLSKEAFFKPTSLVANAVLLLSASLLAWGLYIISLRIWQRYNPRKMRQTGYLLLALAVCAFITISLTGPFDFKDTFRKSSAVSETSIVTASDLKEKPNILWIVMDTVRADHFSCYGYHFNTTPNIDRIASEGVLFEDAISAAPWTLPSHASMFTGMFPSKHGADAEHQWLEDDFKTIAEVLGSYGYMTFGYSNNKVVSRENNIHQGFDIFRMTPWGKGKPGSGLAHFLKANYFIQEIRDSFLMDDGAHRANETVEGWIAEAHQAETPFFVFINYMEAHEPYHPPEAYAAPYLPGGVSLTEAMKVNQQPTHYYTGLAEMDDEDFEILRALYGRRNIIS